MKRSAPLRRTPLDRGSSNLERRTRLKQRRKGPPRRSSRVLDPKHLAFVRGLPCCHCARPGPSDPNHDTAQRGLGQLASDERTVPLCRRCHDDWHGARGHFADWTKHERRHWFEARLAEVIALKTAQEGPTVKQRLRIKLDFTILHETDQPGVCEALEEFSFSGAIKAALIERGVIKGPATIGPGARRELETTQESAA